MDRAGRRRGRRRVWLVGVLIVVLAIAGLAWAYPAVAATYCPRCYGLVPLQGKLYAERGLSTAQQRQIVDVFEAANARVTDFYGDRRSSPRLLVCLSTDCYARIGGGGERGVAVLNRAVMLSPRGIDTVIAAHELSHVELHRRLGSHAGQIPQWFDEGLAVLVADDARYLLPATPADRCRVASGEALPVTLADWLRAAGADEQVYAKAACRVSTYVNAHGGRQAVLDLVDRLNRGDSFASVVGAS
jgi:hypothetical protein